MATTYDAGGANISPAICQQIPASWDGTYQAQGEPPKRFVRGTTGEDAACGPGKFHIEEASMTGDDSFVLTPLVDPETTGLDRTLPRATAGLCDTFCVDPTETDAEEVACKTLSCTVEAWGDADKVPEGYGSLRRGLKLPSFPLDD